MPRALARAMLQWMTAGALLATCTLLLAAPAPNYAGSYGRPVGLAVAWTLRARALVAARDRALLYSRRGRLLVSYRDLRPGRETPIAVAAAGRDLLLGSPAATTGPTSSPAEPGRVSSSADSTSRRSSAPKRRRAPRRPRCGRRHRQVQHVADRDRLPGDARPAADPADHQAERDRRRERDPEAPPAPNMPTEVTLTVPASRRIPIERASSQ